MTELVSKRNKYRREMTATWWKKWDFYKFYMLREATAFAAVWFCLVLLYGIITLGSENGFTTNFVPFLQNPIVVILNLVSIAASILHSVTFFHMSGEVMSGTLGVKSELIRKGFYVVFAVVSVVLLILAFM
ncbi:MULTISPECIES: fumarate reductase subunit FrdC [unclassified Lonepinella]|uniref:fumarate reductase subunit FrdC n=1 Tax=unclassified Lonepinella TaxID=2642006 RepID=UPI003F6DEEED